MKLKLLIAAALVSTPAYAGKPDSPEFSHRPPCYWRIDAGVSGFFYTLVSCTIGEPDMY